MIPILELDSQLNAIESEIRDAVDRVLKSGRFLFGEEHDAFEHEFARYVGAKHAVAVDSGTDAIHLALRALGVREGREVVTVPNTCVPTVAGICAAGAAPALVDVDPMTLTMDPASLEAVLEKQAVESKLPGAIVPVHLYGHPCDMDAVNAVARRFGIPVMEDCAQAHGASYCGRMCGTLGDAAAFSFYPSKNLGAYGDGGAVVTNDDTVAETVRMLRNYGQEGRYHHKLKGYNSRLDEIQAAVLRVKLRHLDEWNAARAKRATLYRERLADAPVTLPPDVPWGRSCHHLFVIRSSARDALREHLAERGIGTQIHYPIPIHLQEAYRDIGTARGAFPVAEDACDSVLSLPMYPELAPESVQKAADSVKSFPF